MITQGMPESLTKLSPSGEYVKLKDLNDPTADEFWWNTDGGILERLS